MKVAVHKSGKVIAVYGLVDGDGIRVLTDNEAPKLYDNYDSQNDSFSSNLSSQELNDLQSKKTDIASQVRGSQSDAELNSLLESLDGQYNP
jgi:hypothetical protein